MKIPTTQAEIRELADVIRDLLDTHTKEGLRLQQMRRVVIASCEHPDKERKGSRTICVDCLWVEESYR